MVDADPITALIELARAALLTAGLSKCEAAGSVYFHGGAGAKGCEARGISSKHAPEVIVLVHGVNDHAGTWAAIAGPLAKTHRVIIPDLAGHGESDPTSGPIPLPLMVEKLHAILDTQKVGKVTLVGNSMGAWVSMLYAVEHPERVGKLVLESGGGMAIAPGVALTAANRDDAVKILRALHGPGIEFKDWQIDRLLMLGKESQLLRVLASNVLPHFLDQRLSEITVPTLVIWGANDGVVTREYVNAVHKGIAGSKLKIIENAAHIPHAQQPDQFLKCLQAIF